MNKQVEEEENKENKIFQSNNEDNFWYVFHDILENKCFKEIE